MHAVRFAGPGQPAATETPGLPTELGDTSQPTVELPATGPELGALPSGVFRGDGFDRAVAACETGSTGDKMRIAPSGVARA